MRDLFTLYKTLVFGHMGLDSLSNGGGRVRRAVSAAVAAVLGGFFIVAHVMLFVPLVRAAVGMEYPGLALELAVTVSGIPGMLFGFFSLLRTLIFAGDIALLAPLPVRRVTVFRSKLAYVYTVCLLACGSVLLPSLAVYSAVAGGDAGFWLRGAAVVLGFPVIVLAIISVLAFPFGVLCRNGKKVSSFSKYAAFLVLPVMDLVLGIFWAVAGDGSGVSAFLSEHWATVKAWSVPPFSWASLSVFSGGMTSVITMALFLFVVLVCAFVAVGILRRLFVRRVSRVLSTSQDRAMR